MNILRGSAPKSFEREKHKFTNNLFILACLVEREYHLFNSSNKTERIKHIAKHGRKFFPKKLHKKRTEMRNYFPAKTQHPNNMKKKYFYNCDNGNIDRKRTQMQW